MRNFVSREHDTYHRVTFIRLIYLHILMSRGLSNPAPCEININIVLQIVQSESSICATSAFISIYLPSSFREQAVLLTIFRSMFPGEHEVNRAWKSRQQDGR